MRIGHKKYFVVKLMKKQGKAKVRDVVSTDITERRLRATVCIQKWFRNRQSISRRTTNATGERPTPSQSNAKEINNNLSQENATKLLSTQKETKEENKLSTNEAKKKERRKRGFDYFYVF